MMGKTEIHIPGGGLKERMASLQKHGEEDWKKRASKYNPDIILTRSSESDEKERTSPVTMRKASGAAESASVARPVSLMDRMSQLSQAQNNWTKKVQEKDTKKFTVEGKMERDVMVKSILSENTPNNRSTPASAAGGLRSGSSTKVMRSHSVNVPSRPGSASKVLASSVTTPRTPFAAVSNGERRTPKMTPFRGSVGPKAAAARPVSLFVDPGSSARSGAGGLTRSVSLRRPSPLSENGHQEKSFLDFRQENGAASPSEGVSDEGLAQQHMADIAEESSIDLDTEVTYRPQLTGRRGVAPPRRTKQSKNPVRALMARQDLVDRSEDLKYEKEIKKSESERSGQHAHLAAEALAGLASTEDFTSVQLRKGGRAVPHQNLLPYRQKMLIQVKGRRFCQCRVVPPVPASINSGDCFLLVTPDQVFNWMGKFSNVIERARAAEVATTILNRKDLGCKSAAGVQTVDEEKLVQCGRENRRFWQALADTDPPDSLNPPGGPQEDEDYEQSIVEATCVYEVIADEDELRPLESAWGLPPKYGMLDPGKVFVFDFGSEVYVYNGKSAVPELRKIGARLAQELWASGYDYTGCDINPIYGVPGELRASSRPDWTVLGRINANMETILFREKFIDWPDKSRVIGKVVGGKDEDKSPVDANSAPTWFWADLAGWTGQDLVDMERKDPDLELEGSHLGRGQEFYDEEERRQYIVETLGVKSWHVEENDSRPLGESFHGQFHTNDTYVVRWRYKVALTGRNLKGGASKYSAVGRERCAYFFWQGEESKISLQGASALQTVELDSEKGPQLRVTEGNEHAAFLSLWQGRMVIYKGGRSSSGGGPSQRLFLVRGHTSLETHLKEVDCDLNSLRSAGVFLLLKKGKIIVWCGRNSEPQVHKMAGEAADRLASNMPAEMGLGSSARVTTMNEGKESSEFWESFSGGTASREAWALRSRLDTRLTRSPRLYHVTSVMGRLEVREIVPDQIHLGTVNNLLFNQATLYSAEQPALFLLDADHSLYLWQGFSREDSEIPSEEMAASNNTGSGMVRWHAERRAAMATMLDYLKVVKRERKDGLTAQLVWAGHEPQQFINLFPLWKPIEEATICNQKCLETSDAVSVYNSLSRSEYSWSELTARPLPPGVDPARIEHYLSDQHFQEKFKYTKAEYESFPRWKQIDMKKKVGLF